MEFLSNTTFWGNSIEQYMYFILTFVCAYFFAIVLKYTIMRYLRKMVKKTLTKIDDILFLSVEEILYFMIGIFAIHFSFTFLNIPFKYQEGIDIALFILSIVIGAYVVDKTARRIIENILKSVIKKTDTKLDDQLLPLTRTVSRTLIWVACFLLIVTNLGYNFTSLVAGLGLGGLAVALAAQQTLGNFFASIAIFTDQPFQLGDMVKFDDVYGKIKQVGFRSTRIITLHGTEIVAPNSKVADAVLENVTKRPTIRTDMTLGLVYDTDLQTLQKAVDIVKTIIKEQENVEDESYVHFDAFGDFSLNIEVRYWIKTQDDWAVVLKTKHDINMEIKKAFEKEGIDFAYPTQEVLLTKK